MKLRPTIFISLVILVTFVLTQFGNELGTYPQNSHIQTASFINHFSQIDTFDFDYEEFDKAMEKLRADLEVLRNENIKIEFDSDKFKEEMEKLSSELENLKMDDLNFELEFDTEEFKKNMKELAEELKNQKLTFHHEFDFDMTELKDEMEALKEEMKDIK